MLNKARIDEYGITLVALIITIIVLIILAAVTINAAFKSDFIGTATNGTINYANAQSYEQKEMDELSDKLDGVINSIKKMQGEIIYNSKVEFSTNTDNYTFDEVEITVTATAPEGETITSIEPVEGNEAVFKEGNTYIVNKNGEYSFKVTTSENKVDIVTKTINNILQAPEIIVSNITETSLDINIESTYPEDSRVKYEYYVDGIKKGDKTTDKECKVSDLSSRINHTVKVLVYISDDNYKEFSKNTPLDFSKITNLSGKTIDENKVEYMYNQGYVNEEFGELKINDPESNSIAEIKDDYIICQTSTRCAHYNAMIYTANRIDLSKYKSINAVIQCTDYQEGNFGTCIFYGNSFNPIAGLVEYTNINRYPSFTNDPSKVYMISCDITKTGEYYPAIHYTYDRFIVYQLFLEKK